MALARLMGGRINAWETHNEARHANYCDGSWLGS